jgi:Flp pilus assembly pilin Flp
MIDPATNRPPAPIAALRQDVRGVTAVEFAIIAPVMCLFLVGALDMAHSLYMTAVLQGVVQKTARDGSMESGTAAAQQALLDERVRKQALLLANQATVTIGRRFYRTFAAAAAAQPEHWTESEVKPDGTPAPDGTCDHGEPYVDANNNGVWDRDGGDGGTGGAKDRVVYTVSVTYPRLLPIYGFLPSVGNTQTVTAKTVLQNQPYGDQGSYTATPATRTCS